MNQPGTNSKLIRVLVADDSAFMRTAITRMIESDPELRVTATAQTGTEALEKIISLQPDVVTLDVEMPGLNGIETLQRVMQQSPRPVIMVSSLTQEGAETTLEALALGAFDYVPKQQSYVSLDIGAPMNAHGLYPWDIVDGSRDDLSMSGSVAIDRSYSAQSSRAVATTSRCPALLQSTAPIRRNSASRRSAEKPSSTIKRRALWR